MTEPSDDEPDAMPELVRLFSPAEADALVPRLEAAFAQIQHHRGKLTALVRQLETHGVDLSETVDPDALARPEVSSLVSRAMHEHAAIKAELGQVEKLGVEVKQIDGLCDVRSRYDGRVVYLCWRRGESGFHHWHELDTGFAGRKRVMRRADFEGTLLH